MIRSFGPNEVLFIVSAIQFTLLLSAVAFAGGMVGGFLVMLARVSQFKALRIAATAFIRVFQSTPLLMQLFLIFFGFDLLGWEVSALMAAAVALTLHASAFLGEIWRGCVESVPRGQSEAGWALGLSYFDRMGSIVLPQATKIAIPPTAGFLVQLIKGTSLASIIGFVELTRAGQIINNNTFQPFLVFGLVAALYFIICWPISLFARRMERRLAVANAR
ncbi:MAG: transporter permease [Burkholderia sp.]|nr:transporter permease [Burkholderia sp.]